jgi:hypothetical protein
MTQDAHQKLAIYLGRSWWMTIITITAQGIIAAAAISHPQVATALATVAAALGLTAAAHTLGRAIEDSANTKANSIGNNHRPQTKE